MLNVQPNEAQIIVAEGDSMRPEVEPGDLLILDTGMQANRGDGLYVFRLEGQIFIKKLQFLPGRVVRAISTNPEYESYKIELAQASQQDFFIVGRVVFHGSTL